MNHLLLIDLNNGKLLVLVIQIVILAFFAILFLQSGLDKVFNYRGNKEWLVGHFSKSPLAGTVGLMLPVLTAVEVLSGACCVAGIVMLLVAGNPEIAFFGVVGSTVSLLMLFFGQRMAQDYPGAGALVPYFLVGLFGLFLFLLEGMFPLVDASRPILDDAPVLIDAMKDLFQIDK